MARRNYFNKNVPNASRHAINPSQLDREIYVNSSYLKKLNNQNNYSARLGGGGPETHHGGAYSMMPPPGHREPDLYRDDASILNTYRRRSNSLSSLHHQHYQYSAMPDFHYPPQHAATAAVAAPQVILPSPTTADYLRNRTRETALINVVMKPTQTPNDVEISQILYDDLAYRQLRKDSEAQKFAHIKAVNSLSSAANMPNLVNITTLPIHAQRPTGYDSPGVNKTVKMIKQKDAINKRYSNNNNANYGDARSGYQNYEHANRYVIC